MVSYIEEAHNDHYVKNVERLIGKLQSIRNIYDKIIESIILHNREILINSDIDFSNLVWFTTPAQEKLWYALQDVRKRYNYAVDYTMSEYHFILDHSELDPFIKSEQIDEHFINVIERTLQL